MTQRWRPIKSAPKDGTRILVFEPNQDDEGQYVTSWQTFEDGFGHTCTGWICPDGGELGPWTTEPTHWKPLGPDPK